MTPRQEWGRKSYGWPSRKPVWTLAALVLGAVAGIATAAYQYQQWTFLEKQYLSVYMGSGARTWLKNAPYQLLFRVEPGQEPRAAVEADFDDPAVLDKRVHLEWRRGSYNNQRLNANERAPDLTFPDGMTRTRRDHMKYLTLIRAITLLHQHQRPIKTTEHRGKTVEYIEATEQDVALAKQLINDALVRSLDELPPQTKRLLLLVDDLVAKACEEQQLVRSEYRFSRRDVRTYTRWSDSQLKRHLARLEELEYLIVHRGGRGQSFVYELYVTAQGEESKPVLSGLMTEYDTNKSGSEGEKSGPSPAQVRGMSGDGSGEESPAMKRLKEESALKTQNLTTKEKEENPVIKKAAAGVK